MMNDLKNFLLPFPNGRSFVLLRMTFILVFLLTYASSIHASTDWFYGSWEYQECDSKNIMCMVLDYSFDKNGSIHLDGYPPLRQKGKFKVISIDAKNAVLKISNASGDLGEWKKQISLEYDASKNTIKIDGQGPYVKLKPVKTNFREPNEK